MGERGVYDQPGFVRVYREQQQAGVLLLGGQPSRAIAATQLGKRKYYVPRHGHGVGLTPLDPADGTGYGHVYCSFTSV